MFMVTHLSGCYNTSSGNAGINVTIILVVLGLNNPLCCNLRLFVLVLISRVSDQNGVSLLYIMLEMHHSGRESSISFMFIMSH